MTTKQSDETERLAYHEAGHAVAACFFGHFVGRATIRRRGDETGSCTSHPSGWTWDRVYRGGRFPQRRRLLQLMAEDHVVRLAGSCAEAAFCGPPNVSADVDHVYEAGWGPDWEHVLDTAGKAISQSELDVYLEVQAKKAALLFSPDSPLLRQVQAVASALLERKTLKGKEVALIIRGASEPSTSS